MYAISFTVWIQTSEKLTEDEGGSKRKINLNWFLYDKEV